MNIRHLIFTVLLVFSFGGFALAEPVASPKDPPKHSFVFKSYDGDPTAYGLKNASFQVDQLDKRNPAQFLKIGDFVPGTKFKLAKFEYKTRLDPKIQEQVDCSELTIQNVETNETIVLILK